MTYFPYKINATKEQCKRLVKGETIRLKPNQSNANCVVHLTKTQISRIESNKSANRGTDIFLSNRQLYHNHKHGSGIFSWLKDKASALHKFLRPHISKAADNLAVIAKEKGNQLLDKAKNKAEQYANEKINHYSDKISDKINSFGSSEKKETHKPGRKPVFQTPSIPPPSFDHLALKSDLKKAIRDAPELPAFPDHLKGSGVKKTRKAQGVFDLFTAPATNRLPKPALLAPPRTVHGEGFWSDVGDVFKGIGEKAVQAAAPIAQKYAEGYVKKKFGLGMKKGGRTSHLNESRGVQYNHKNDYVHPITNFIDSYQNGRSDFDPKNYLNIQGAGVKRGPGRPRKHAGTLFPAGIRGKSLRLAGSH